MHCTRASHVKFALYKISTALPRFIEIRERMMPAPKISVCFQCTLLLMHNDVIVFTFGFAYLGFAVFEAAKVVVWTISILLSSVISSCQFSYKLVLINNTLSSRHHSVSSGVDCGCQSTRHTVNSSQPKIV